MIKFFRKIRQNLLSENKISKYLIYAIGEIVLVVIGILIALQVNNWNEEKKSTYLLKTYEKSIINELNEDIIQINKVDSIVDLRLKSIEDYLEYNQSEIVNMIELKKKRDSTQLHFVIFQTNNFSLQDLIISGNLQLFPVEKKKLLLKHNLLLSQYESTILLVMGIVKDKYNEFENDIDKISLTRYSSKKELQVNNWENDINSHQLRKQNNYIVTFLDYFQVQKQYLKRLKDNTEELKIKLEN